MDWAATLIGGGIGSIIAALTTLLLLRANLRRLQAQTAKMAVESEGVEAQASEVITRTALSLLGPLQVQLEKLQRQVCRLERNRVRAASELAVHADQIMQLQRDLASAQQRISELEEENRRYRALLRAHDIDPEKGVVE